MDETLATPLLPENEEEDYPVAVRQLFEEMERIDRQIEEDQKVTRRLQSRVQSRLDSLKELL
jgi:hypothetical protein